MRRRRRCNECEGRFTTYERMETFPIEVVKRDGRREEFDRQKLVVGLRKACDKRPIPREKVEELVDSVESALVRAGRTEVPSSAIGEAVMQGLRELDEVAYIRFASVYRRFQDAEGFLDEVNRLDRGRTRQPPTNQLALFAEPDLEAAELTPPNGGASIDSSPAAARPPAGRGRGRRRATG